MPRLVARLTGLIHPPKHTTSKLHIPSSISHRLDPHAASLSSSTAVNPPICHSTIRVRPSTFIYPSLLHPSISPSSTLFPRPTRLSTPLPLPHLTPTPLPSHQLLQVRFTVRGNYYQPSQRKRKRRHGFLVRLRTVNGRKMIKRRLLKGRKNVSH